MVEEAVFLDQIVYRFREQYEHGVQVHSEISSVWNFNQ